MADRKHRFFGSGADVHCINCGRLLTAYRYPEDCEASLQDALKEAYTSGRYGHASTGVDMKFKIFGRSPTLALQAVAAVLTFLVTFGWDRLTAEHAGLIVAFLTAIVGAVNAWVVVPRNPALFATAFTSGAALLTAYGLDLSQEQIGTANMAVTAIMAFLLLNFVTPAADPAVGGGVSAKDVPGVPGTREPVTDVR